MTASDSNATGTPDRPGSGGRTLPAASTPGWIELMAPIAGVLGLALLAVLLSIDLPVPGAAALLAVVAMAALTTALYAHAVRRLRQGPALERLRLSEERFRDFAQTSSDWFWEQDAELRFVRFSHIMRIPSLDHGVNIGKTRRQLVTRGVTPEQWAAHEADLAARRPFRDFRYELEARDGECRHVSTSGVPIFDENGVFQGYRGTGRDITAQVRAEVRLRLSEERFQDFALTGSDWFWEQDAELRFVEMLDVSGRMPATAPGRIGKRRWENPKIQLTEADWVEHKADLAARRPFRDLRYARYDDKGELGWVSISGRPVFDANGTFTGYRGVGRDITPQMRAEAALRLSEERFRALALTSSDWFWEQDADLRFITFSEVENGSAPYYRDLIGLTRREAIGDTVPPEQWAVHQADLDARRPFRDFRYRRVRPDGRVRHISIGGVPVFDHGGTFKGYRGTARDVTAQVNAEAALRQAKDEAEAASRTKSQFLANMSHELRTPLNAILGFSEVIRDGIMGPVEQRYRDYGGDIHRAGQHLLTLIGDILDLSKIEVGRLELREETVDLVATIDACQRLLAERARDGGVTVERMVPADLPAVQGDRLRLKQILLNLLSNAVKFTPAGGRVVIRAGRTGDGGLEIAVVDSGIGMRPEDIPVALAPFRQVEDAFNRRFEGTGLGLPLARTLAELHGGRLELESKPDHGTVVRVLLPAARVMAAAA